MRLEAYTWPAHHKSGIGGPAIRWGMGDGFWEAGHGRSPRWRAKLSGGRRERQRRPVYDRRLDCDQSTATTLRTPMSGVDGRRGVVISSGRRPRSRQPLERMRFLLGIPVVSRIDLLQRALE